MGDLKDIKRWGRKARPHIFALEPRMLFDGVSVAPHDHPNEFISSVKVIDFIDSNISHAIDNQLILNDIKTTVRIDLAESRASLGNIVRLYKDNEENLSAQLGNDYVISDDDIQKGFVDLEIRSFLEDFSQLSAKICEQDDQIHLSEIFDVTQRALGKNDFTNQFNIQDISLIENCYKDHLIDALVRVDKLLNNLPNQLNCEDLFRDLFGAAGTDPTSFAQNMDRLFDRLRSTGLNLNVEFISDAELKGNKAVFAPMQSELTEPTIYINTTWLSLNPSSASIQKTLLEEVGHFFDYELNLGQISNGAAG